MIRYALGQDEAGGWIFEAEDGEYVKYENVREIEMRYAELMQAVKDAGAETMARVFNAIQVKRYPPSSSAAGHDEGEKK